MQNEAVVNTRDVLAHSPRKGLKTCDMTRDITDDLSHVAKLVET
ncbi:hypothetical protein [Entomobacter blattae]|uniref:Uncharacterized protein n=1 Tax=Entomobacter blattae TaxID=2762277 RepID=A0A7H1NQG7_9PROT|nr:hypothetical protein [Entomobacter blattae]QNT78027.1 hypothetical protein JGUZn3_07940 [Entomobacter blattae]